MQLFDKRLPLLVFSEPKSLDERKRKGGGTSSLVHPGKSRQDQRLSPRFQQLQNDMQAREWRLAADPTGKEPRRPGAV